MSRDQETFSGVISNFRKTVWLCVVCFGVVVLLWQDRLVLVDWSADSLLKDYRLKSSRAVTLIGFHSKPPVPYRFILSSAENIVHC